MTLVESDIRFESEQELFNHVCEHLMDQDEQSITNRPHANGELDTTDSNGEIKNCLYRHPEKPLMCAAGCVLPDSFYDPEMEGYGVDVLVERWGEILPSFFGEYKNILCCLQATHDNHLPEDWARELATLAASHGLTVPNCVSERMAEED